MNNKKIVIYDLAVCGIFAALMCVLGPLSIPIGPVPISLTIVVVCLAVYLLGYLSSVSVIIYILIGLIGFPVFSGGAGGFGKLLGATGGYIIGFIFLALIGSVFLKLSKGNFIITALGLILGIAVDYLLGTAWFVFITKSTWAHALDVCVYPFIPFDLGKVVVATAIGKPVRVALIKAGLLPADKKAKKEVDSENAN